MASFIMVAGVMSGAWVWERVTPLLEAAGHEAIALDLPGLGVDTSIAAEAVTLADWGAFVAAKVCAATPPVVLVGHSRGGLVIGEAAERVPSHVAGLIYIAALIVPPGGTFIEMTGVGDGAPPPEDVDLSPKHLFFNRCSDEDMAAALARMKPEPPRPMTDPATVTWQRWGRVPRGFITCSDDNSLNAERKAAILGAVPCDPLVEIDADHSPMLCAPERLAEAMLRVTEALLRQLPLPCGEKVGVRGSPA